MFRSSVKILGSNTLVFELWADIMCFLSPRLEDPLRGLVLSTPLAIFSFASFATVAKFVLVCLANKSIASFSSAIISLFMNCGRRIFVRYLRLPYDLSRLNCLKLAICFWIGRSFYLCWKAIAVSCALKLCGELCSIRGNVCRKAARFGSLFFRLWPATDLCKV